MKHKADIEAALERSLREQLNVPRLDARFDAAVWARIEAEESRRAAPAAQIPARATASTARWLNIINVIGLASVAIFFCAFGAQLLADMDVSFSLPQIPAATAERILADASTVIATVAVAFGFMFTPWGRRLREELG
jgi:hypothetical protein